MVKVTVLPDKLAAPKMGLSDGGGGGTAGGEGGETDRQTAVGTPPSEQTIMVGIPPGHTPDAAIPG